MNERPPLVPLAAVRPVTRVIPWMCSVGALAFLCGALSGAAAPDPAAPGDLEIKAAFVLNFIRLTKWSSVPEERNVAELPVCAAHRSDFFEAARGAAEGRVVANRLIVFRIEPAPDVRRCRILLVDRTNYQSARQMLSAVRNTPVLTVGNGPGFLDAGGMLELFVQDGLVRFDAGFNAIRVSGLDISARLLQLSRNLRKGRHGTD